MSQQVKENPMKKMQKRYDAEFKGTAACWSAAIAREFGESWDKLKSRRGHPAQSFAIILSRRHTALTFREIGERCGGSVTLRLIKPTPYGNTQ
jgi:hypothetical protein